MKSWADYLPDGGQARDVVEAARVKAREDAAALPGVFVDVTAAAKALGAAAAEATRLWVLTKHSSEVTAAWRWVLERVVPSAHELVEPEAAAGLLAYVNVVLAHGGDVSGWYDRTTRAGLEREVELVARFAGRHPTLDYAALAAGRTDLVRDRKVAALTTPDAILDFVERFPDADAGYGDLMFVARAWVVQVEMRGPGGFGAAASWLHRAIHGGRDAARAELERQLAPPAPAPPRPPPDPQTAERAAFLFGPPVAHAPLAWTAISLNDVQGLWGGRAIAVGSNGNVQVVDVERGHVHSRTLDAHLTPAGLAELDALVTRHDPRRIEIPMQNGIPDECHPTISFVAGGARTSVMKWASQAHPDFDALLAWLESAARVLSATR